jgi:hypothetical protein
LQEKSPAGIEIIQPAGGMLQKIVCRHGIYSRRLFNENRRVFIVLNQHLYGFRAALVGELGDSAQPDPVLLRLGSFKESVGVDGGEQPPGTLTVENLG